MKHPLVFPNTHAGRRFTLIEMLVVIAIISILFSMLAPTLQSARDGALSVVCLNNIKTFASAMTMYAEGYSGRCAPLAAYNDTTLRNWEKDSIWFGNKEYLDIFMPDGSYKDSYCERHAINPSGQKYLCPNLKIIAWENKKSLLSCYGISYMGTTVMAGKSSSAEWDMRRYIRLSKVLRPSVRYFFGETVNSGKILPCINNGKNLRDPAQYWWMNSESTTTPSDYMAYTAYPHGGLTKSTMSFFDNHAAIIHYGKLMNEPKDNYRPYK